MAFGMLEQQGVAHLWALGRACSDGWDPVPGGGDHFNSAVIHNHLWAQAAPQEA